MKAEGLRPGVPDTFLPVAVAPFHGLYVELKKPGREREKPCGGRSEEQVKWQRSMVEEGYAVATAYGWEAAAHALSLYFSGAFDHPADGDCLLVLTRTAPPW